MTAKLSTAASLAALLIAASCTNDSGDDTAAPTRDAGSNSAGSSSTDADVPSQDSGPSGTPICDGSDGIRLGIWTGGGFVSEDWVFMHPYGAEFAFVDGQCGFYASTNAMKGIATGTLTAADAEQLATEISWAKIDAFSQHTDAVCDDAGDSKISNGSHAFGCSCGCEDGAPAGLAAAEAASHMWTQRLAERGTPLDGAVRALLLEAGDGVPGGTPKWPLSRSYNEFLRRGTIDATSGVLVDDATEIEQLRTLRQLTIMQNPNALGIQVDIGSSGVFGLYVRDELPPAVASAAAIFQLPPME